MAQPTAQSASALTAQAVVESFLKDWETGFLGAFERWFHPEGLWQNTGFPDAQGKNAIMGLLDRYLQVSQMPYGRAELRGIASDGRIVLTERIDHLWNDEGKKHSAKIMGAFEVRDGLISRYSDYFDPRPFFDSDGH